MSMSARAANASKGRVRQSVRTHPSAWRRERHALGQGVQVCHINRVAICCGQILGAAAETHVLYGRCASRHCPYTDSPIQGPQSSDGIHPPRCKIPASRVYGNGSATTNVRLHSIPPVALSLCAQELFAGTVGRFEMDEIDAG